MNSEEEPISGINMPFRCSYEESLACRSDSGIESEEQQRDSRKQVRKSKKINHNKGDDPLSDPLVRSSLIELNITGPQLIEMSVKDLNKRLVSCPQITIDTLKKCRRTLKNRGYAKSCRVKRIAARNHLEQINKRLARENRELKQRNKSLAEQFNQLESKVANQERLLDQITNCRNRNHTISNSFVDNQVDLGTEVKQEIPVGDRELLSLYECADTYPTGVELDQIAQSISSDGWV